jgi:hypothetical protein
VCWVKQIVTYEDNGHMTGLQFGQRTSKSVCARIYDETTEMRRSRVGCWAWSLS